jgi:hypothetical protein
MNTLSRAVTARFFTEPNGYYALRRHWSALMNSQRKHELTAVHHILYLALCGKDWRRSFAPITSRRKLLNGAYYGWALFRTLRVLNSTLHEDELLEPFGGLVTRDTLLIVRGYLRHVNLYKFGPGNFAVGSFPVDAYTTEPVDAATEGRVPGGAGNG